MLQSEMPTITYPAQLPLIPVTGPVDARVALPGSKSITNRALLLAALATGDTTLRGPLHSDDTVVMRDALVQLGVPIDGNTAGDILVHGVSGKFTAPRSPEIFIGNSGTTVRFMTAAAALMPSDASVIFDGVSRMRERPIADLLETLTMLGVEARSLRETGCPPIYVRGGGINGGTCRIRGNISSQFLSAILMIVPYAKSNTDIVISGELISKPYVDLTCDVMKSFGVQAEWKSNEHLHVKARQSYVATDYTIEADASNASYFFAAAAITGGRVTITNLGKIAKQGDIKFLNVLEEMGCTVSGTSRVTVQGPRVLFPVQANMESIPDTAQTLAVLAAFADGTSTINGISSLRVKETDRVSAVTNELGKMGVHVVEGHDSWVITPPEDKSCAGASISTYDDHRMAMSFAVAGLKMSGLEIENPGCVAKTFPDFWLRWSTAFPS